MALEIKSSAFDHNASIPQKYTCDGQDISPPLQWSGAPSGAQSFVLINDDPDAPVGTWDHWILFNLPAATNSLAESIKSLPAGTLEGKNSWGKTGYGGPCPPEGVHRYFFKLYALDTALNLKNGAAKREIESAMKGHILAQAELMGRYQRKR
ncbi:MAG: YbhB/YbcL family Raf kinase inhibitor-like protein [Deltaproteobacteria bacterium]|nr:YbhB/YbcL family Raf kinase inhibitor-like protein [Deltaproteobacteria bacterium]